MKKKTTKEKFYAARKHIKIWDVDADNMIISKLYETKTNSKYLIGHTDKAFRPLGLIMSKMSGLIKIFRVKNGDKDKKINWYHSV